MSMLKDFVEAQRERRDLGFVKGIVRPKKLEALFLFVTSKCNSKCRTCFYHDKLNDGRDMTFDEIRRISQTAPRFDKLWLSGGEPFMRKDLVDVIRLFVETNGVKVINLPSNGLLGDRIEKGLDELLEVCPGLEVHFNLSLDGIGETHEAVRGVPGGFHKTLSTLWRVKERYRDNPKLIVNVATVITPDNYDEILDLGAYLLKHRLCAVQFLETVRGDPKDPQTKTLSAQQIQSLYERYYPFVEYQSKHLFEDFGPVGEAIATRFFLGFVRFVNERQLENLDGPTPWGMDCTAGLTTLVVDHDGAFRSCEMRPPIGNMRAYSFDTGAVLASKALRDEIAEIGGGKGANCWCTHGCWIMSSMKFSPKAMLVRMPGAYLSARHLHQEGFTLPEVDETRFQPPEERAAESKAAAEGPRA